MQKNLYVKITSPNGSVNVVPAASNKAYYEKFNAQEKAKAKHYKIEEPTDEEIAKFFPEVGRVSAATAEKKEKLASAEAKVAELNAAKEESDKAKTSAEAKVAELTKELAAANKQVDDLQSKLNKATK